MLVQASFNNILINMVVQLEVGFLSFKRDYVNIVLIMCTKKEFIKWSISRTVVLLDPSYYNFDIYLHSGNYINKWIIIIFSINYTFVVINISKFESNLQLQPNHKCVIWLVRLYLLQQILMTGQPNSNSPSPIPKSVGTCWDTIFYSTFYLINLLNILSRFF